MALKVTHNGKTYEWQDSDWVDVRTQMVAPAAIKTDLNAAFVGEIENSEIIKSRDPDFRAGLFSLLRTSMGVGLEKLVDMGFLEEALEINPELVIGHVMRCAHVPNGNTFANCVRLRDRFFEDKPADGFDLPVKLLGSGPFLNQELKQFLKTRGIKFCKKSERVHVLILGRSEWKKPEVDAVLEEAEGAVLRVYSQEMFLSVLAGHPDPFRAWPLSDRLWDLYAFRAGHPGLEYVSNGWAGWIKGVGSRERIAWAGGEATDFHHVDQSPLHALGYHVGETGLEEYERRQILRSAFLEPLPFVESPAYMEEWGEPNAAQRLKRIAQHLANNIDKQRYRANLKTALEHWQSDLEWLKETFYRGAYTFSWPQV